MASILAYPLSLMALFISSTLALVIRIASSRAGTA